MEAAFIFPGQGSQVVGMGQALFATVPEARWVFEEVDAALHEPLSRLIFEGPDERLRLTENTQPALMAVSLAVLRALEARSDRTLGDLLVKQVTARVRWRESLHTLADLGVEHTVELGSRRVLSGLARRTLEHVATSALGTPEEIDAYVETLPVLAPRRRVATA